MQRPTRAFGLWLHTLAAMTVGSLICCTPQLRAADDDPFGPSSNSSSNPSYRPERQTRTTQQSRPALGISMSTDEAEGLQITQVKPRSPAAQAGLRAGDE